MTAVMLAAFAATGWAGGCIVRWPVNGRVFGYCLLPPRIRSDTMQSVYIVLRSDEFDKWLVKLKDAKGKARIVARIKSAEFGNLGM